MLGSERRANHMSKLSAIGVALVSVVSTTAGLIGDTRALLYTDKDFARLYTIMKGQAVEYAGKEHLLSEYHNLKVNAFIICSKIMEAEGRINIALFNLLNAKNIVDADIDNSIKRIVKEVKYLG